MSFRVRVAITAVLALTLSACGGGSSGETRTDAKSGETPPPIVADASTLAAAQALVDTAGDRLLDDGTGRYELTWGAGKLQTRTVGEYSIHAFATKTTTTEPTENSNDTTEIIYLGGDAFGRSYVSGRPEGCWGHVSRGKGADARTLAYPLPVVMMFRPKVRGFVRGGDGSEVVVDISLNDGTSAAVSRFANAHTGEIPAKATIPARLKIVGGAYRSLSYRLVDLLEGLKDSGLEVVAGSDLPPRTFGIMPDEVVRIEFASGGADVDIKRPPSENVTEMDGVPLGDQPPPCASKPRS
jgi:hypothetical protein